MENIISNEANQSENESKTCVVEPNTDSVKDEVVIPVKYNKQVFNLDLEKAQELAQKGMKYDVISKDYDTLKIIARAEVKSVAEFLESIKNEKNSVRENEILLKCGGDKEFAEHILKLENSNPCDRLKFSEVSENFPKIKTVEDLPQSVVESAKLKGTLLLDEYLRYLHKQQLAIKASVKNQFDAEQSATGSLVNKKGAQSPETAEFLRGLWQK